MRIENTGPLAGVRRKKTSAASGGDGSSFEVNEGSELTQTAATTAPTNVTNLDALLSLQAVDDEKQSKRKMAERGFDLLDRLEEMRLGLLMGRMSATQVNRISQKVRSLGVTGDPNLDAIISDIDMRARVELAKLGVYDI